MHDGDADFATALGPRILAVPLFRTPTDEEVDASYEAYQRRDVAGLLEAWEAVAEPTRSLVPFPASLFYERAGLLAPKAVNAASFLLTIRVGLAAGVRFRAGLSAPTLHAIEHDFPWLEQRHQHIPDGWTPPFDFPDIFQAFVDVPDLEEAKVRWQLAAALNEVQQCVYSRYGARIFRLPELMRHAEREEALAHNYFGHWSPDCTRELWRQTIWVLDALNAAIFAWVTQEATVAVVCQSMKAAIRGEEWAEFVAALDAPQVLLPV